MRWFVLPFEIINLINNIKITAPNKNQVKNTNSNSNNDCLDDACRIVDDDESKQNISIKNINKNNEAKNLTSPEDDIFKIGVNSSDFDPYQLYENGSDEQAKKTAE